MEEMYQEGDEDAALVADFESALNELAQDDGSLASAYTAYQEARRRLSEKFRNRGFWPTSRGGGGKSRGKGFQKGKNSFNQFGKSKRTLQDRIMSSNCRNCGRRGHWRAECPYKNSGQEGTSAGSTSATVPTTTLVTENGEDFTGDSLPLEFLNLPSIHGETVDEERSSSHVHVFADSFVVGCRSAMPSISGVIGGQSWMGRSSDTVESGEAMKRLRSWGFGNGRTDQSRHAESEPAEPKFKRHAFSSQHPKSSMLDSQLSQGRTTPMNPQQKINSQKPCGVEINESICFATHSTYGIVDLGASKTVIGSDHVQELIQGLDQDIRRRLKRCECQITFRFGNQGTLKSSQALVIPIGDLQLKVAIVPGGTPFLLSNSLMRVIRAQIDCQNRVIRSPLLSKPVSMQLTNRGLFLIDMNQLAAYASRQGKTAGRRTGMQCPESTFMTCAKDPQKSPAETVVPVQKVSFECSPEPAECTNNPGIKVNQGVNNNHQDNGSGIKAKVQNENDDNHLRNQHETCVTQQVQANESSEMHIHDTPGPTVRECSELGESPEVASHRCHDHVAPESPAESSIDRDASPAGKSRSSHSGRPGTRSHHFRDEAQRRGLPDSIPGQGVDTIHGHEILRKSQGGPSQVSEVRGAQSDRGGEPSSGGDAQSQSQESSQGKGQGIPSSQSLRIGQLRPSGGLSRFDRRLGFRTRDVRPEDYECPAWHEPGRVCGPADKGPSHGECADAHHQSLGGQPPDRELREPIDDPEAPVFTALSSERQRLGKLICAIQAEADQVMSQVKAIGKKFDLGEVFCSRHSTLTHQVQQQNGQAFRFGYDQGDLSTSVGRHQLFLRMAQHRPRHLWFSPVCGPWSQWSHLNAAKSVEKAEEYHRIRQDLLYQVALGIVLFRIQMARGDHFHLEQPRGSLLLQIPMLSEVHAHTQACQFDMCTAGSLVDPISKEPIKKPMTLLTSQPSLYHQLHGMKCQSHEHHQHIEGTIKLSQGNIHRSVYTENYPRRFSRMIARVMMHQRQDRPFHWSLNMLEDLHDDHCFAGAGVRKTMRPKPKFAKSELITPTSDPSHQDKRRKLEGKLTTTGDLELCKSIVQKVSQILPRVGKREILDAEVIQQCQNLFNDKMVIKVWAGRGMDRTMPPPKGIHPEESPFRRTLMLMRYSDEVKYEKSWENWTQLSQRQLVRPAHQCRINITVFGKDRSVAQGQSVSSSASQSPEISPDVTSMPADRSLDMNQVPSPQTPHASTDADPARSSTLEEPNPSSLGTSPPASGAMNQNQSLRFRMLPRWDQKRIIHMHKNLGHPSGDRLSKALHLAGERPEVVQAAKELKCAACAHQSPPKTARPSALKPMLDFNHRIYLDGVNWTNAQSQEFHFYHILDAGSNYNVAMAAPTRTSDSVIKVLNQGWIQWAGPPSELIVDSATELNSHLFAEFAQRFSIRTITTNPDAHWQSGRIERHGQFIQTMLSRIDQEFPINSYEELQSALNQCTHAKNSLSVQQGYSPEIIVFGKSSRLPGSILSDESIPAHERFQSEDQQLDKKGFQQMLQIRESARRAFHAADNCTRLRRAMQHRSCPHRGDYQKGDWVMTWRVDGYEKPQWTGPHRVIIQDDKHTIWSTSMGKLHRSAPENTREAYPEEGHPLGPTLPEDMTQINQQIERLQKSPEDDSEDPLVLPEIGNENNPDNGNSNPEELGGPRMHSTSQDSISDRIQSDQEPEREISHEPSSNPPLDSNADEQGVDLLLLSEDVPDALTENLPEATGWRVEFELPLPQPLSEHKPDPLESWIMLATSAKKQRTEVKLCELTPEERQEFETAKQAEVQNWIQTGTLSKVLKSQIPADQILKCRWILTWKALDQVGLEPQKVKSRTHKAKARLVVLGYLDPKIEEIPRDSPTLGRTARMMILQILASHRFPMRSFDIKAAFLQGRPQSSRVMAIDPVPELRQAMKMSPNEVGKLNKGAYGLIDAPYLWYCALVTELERLKFEASPFDPCLFVLRYPADHPRVGQISGILGIHVDDGLGGGDSYFDQQVAELEKVFAFGSKRTGAFTFTGIEISQHGDHSITLNQSAYVRKIPPIAIDINRKTLNDSPVTEEERLALRGLIGSLQYAATNTRPDISSRLSMLQSTINKANVENLHEANRLLHETKKHHDVTITIKPIPPDDFRFMAFSDASFSSTKKPDSHAGSIIVGTHKDITKNHQCDISPISWGCKKIQRVVLSTLSAETTALSSAVDQVSWLRLFWQWIHDPSTAWKRPEEALLKIAPALTVPTLAEDLDVAITDCKSLYDLITRTATPSCAEFRVQLTARAIKEAMQEGTHLRWVHSGAQLADALTKAMDAQFLRTTLKTGQYRLCDETALLKERAKTRDRIKWLKQPENHENSNPQ